MDILFLSPLVFQSSTGAGKIISKWFVGTCIWSDSGTFAIDPHLLLSVMSQLEFKLKVRLTIISKLFNFLREKHICYIVFLLTVKEQNEFNYLIFS